MSKLLTPSPAAVAIIKEFEGCRLKAYRDGGGVLTIGYGHTGPAVTEGLAIDQPTADLWLAKDLASVARALNRLVAVPLDQCQVDALCSFVFNVGAGALARSTLLARLNAGAPDQEVAAQFARWVKDNGQVVPGLVRRREAERKLFLGES
jgi:lysozyme